MVNALNRPQESGRFLLQTTTIPLLASESAAAEILSLNTYPRPSCAVRTIMAGKYQQCLYCNFVSLIEVCLLAADPGAIGTLTSRDLAPLDPIYFRPGGHTIPTRV